MSPSPASLKRGVSLRAALGLGLSCLCLPAETLTILNSQAGTTPLRLGYNLGHFMPGSNAADWFRYSGADAARIFISVSEIEPVDDLAPAGDGVDSETTFFNRRALLRANAASPAEALNGTYVRWSSFADGYADTAAGNNRLQYRYALENLAIGGVAILANITASPSRFPITGTQDWAGKWELWQHYYAQAFLLSRDYGVRNYSMFNEPNGWTGMTEADWLLRHRICSDAIQSAMADMNTRYGRALVPQIFAANTANGAEKYNTIGTDADTTETWGHDAVANRHLRLDGTTATPWMNLHVYNYQKYTTRTHPSGGLSGYVTDYNTLRGYLNADTTGETPLPMALTEFNVRTGASYDTTTATQDSPLDFAALGANCIALTERGIQQLYLFKFGQTASSSTYGVAKNGTHYVENSSGSGHNYGGATQGAEVYRLFLKASQGQRPRLNSTATAGALPTNTAGLWSQATHDAATGTYHVFLANKEASPIPLQVDFSALALPAGNPVFVEEVSGASHGGVVRLTKLNAGKLAESPIPAQSVWLITVPAPPLVEAVGSAVADTELGDGLAKSQPGGSVATMRVRADGTADGRRVSLIRIRVPAGNSPRIHSFILQLDAATTPGSLPVQAHVYGVDGAAWQETTATWAGSPALLKQNVPDGGTISRNIVSGQGTTARVLGQLMVNSPVRSVHSLDVTDFVRSRTDGFASFLVVQDHRWDIAQPALTPGDIQPAGLTISSRESDGVGPRLVALMPEPSWILWKKASFAAAWENETLTAAAADPDQDGMENLLEYALGGDPLTPRTDPLPTLRSVEDRIEFQFSGDAGHDDLRRTVQVALEPGGTWTDAAVAVRERPFVSLLEGVTVSETGNGLLRTITLREPRNPAWSRRFLRLKVELLPP